MVHFNWLQLAPGVNHENLHIATLALGSGVMIATGLVARLALGSGQTAVLPATKFGFKGFFEVLVEFINGLAVSVIGDEGKRFVPLLATVFFFVFTNNLIGLIPGMTPATDNINTTFALGLFAFIVYNFYGIREHGVHYIKQFMGPILILAPVMLLLEGISHLVRPFSLALRLYGNMVGDHTTLGIFTELAPYFVPVIFYGLGLMVCVVQAFVFTLLTMVYISMAISHDH